MRLLWAAAGVAVAVLVGGCGGSEPSGSAGGTTSLAAGSTTAAAEPTREPDGPAFPDGYSPKVRKRIDKLAAGEDCDGLQAEFDQAESNAAEGHADLMAYIDAAMRGAGCY